MRAQDIHMAATAHLGRKLVLVTGAIDQNDQNLVMRIKLPSPGVWTFVKAEVNLTTESWFAWVITLGGGFRLPDSDADSLAICQQLRHSRYMRERGSIIFNDGEIRPGECILKLFNVVYTGDDGLVAAGEVSHARLAGPADSEAVLRAITDNFGEERPSIEVSVPVRVI